MEGQENYVITRHQKETCLEYLETKFIFRDVEGLIVLLRTLPLVETLKEEESDKVVEMKKQPAKK